MADEHFLREASALFEQALQGPLNADTRDQILRMKAKVDALLAAKEQRKAG